MYHEKSIEESRPSSRVLLEKTEARKIRKLKTLTQIRKYLNGVSSLCGASIAKQIKTYLF
jgi:hypothetical protein